MEDILKQILKQLEYQTKLMENLYERKDTQMHDVNKSMDVLKQEFAKHPEIMQSQVGKIMNDLFSRMGGK